MAEIARNPAVEDYVVEADWPDIRRDINSIANLYEDGRLIILRGVRLDLDFDFLNTISYDVDVDPEIRRIFKKYPTHKILGLPRANVMSGAGQFAWRSILGQVACRWSRPLRERIGRDPVARAERLFAGIVFKGDRQRFRYFQEQVRSGHEQVMELCERLFPTYRIDDVVGTWRLSETAGENLHWDNFKERKDFHQVRIFANLDTRPRIWRTSHRIENYVRGHERSEDLMAHARSQHPNRFTHYLNTKELDDLPRHTIHFEQGEVWLAETRIVSHEIHHGYRALAYMFYVDPTTMLDPERRFNRRVQRLHAGAAVAAKQSRPPVDF